MKKHYTKKSKLQNSKYQTEEVGNTEGQAELNQTAAELNSLARTRLRDKVLRGILKGYEDEIRQDAILLSLGWYVREKMSPDKYAKYSWCPPRAIAAALKIQKREYIKALKGKAEMLDRFSLELSGVNIHPSQVNVSAWPTSARRTVVQKAIRIALRNNQISAVNAVVGVGLLVDGIPARTLATRLKVSRSAIYQHLGRVRRAIPNIIESIDVPMHELL